MGGDPDYGANAQSFQVTVNPAPADTLTYTSNSAMTNGSSATLSATLTDISGDPLSGQTLTFVLAPAANAQRCTGVTNSSGVASCAINPVNEPTGTRTVAISFAGDIYPANSLDAYVTVNPGVLDTITYTGDQTFTDGTSGTLSATLTDASTGAPISGQPLTLALAPAGVNQDCTAVTNAAGLASCIIPKVDAAAGERTVQVTFAGVGGYPANQIDTSVTVSAGLADTMTYAGGQTFVDGESGTLSATLADGSGNPIQGQTITLSLAPALTNQDCSAITDASGVATCAIVDVQAPAGVRTARAVFAGAAGYAANQLDTPVTVT